MAVSGDQLTPLEPGRSSRGELQKREPWKSPGRSGLVRPTGYWWRCATVLVTYLWPLVHAAVLFGSACQARPPGARPYVAVSFVTSIRGALFSWEALPSLPPR